MCTNIWQHHRLWSADERFLGALGVSAFLPTYLRIAYLAGYSALASMLLIALVSKLSMRMLLNYQNWMFEKKVLEKIFGTSQPILSS